MDVLIHNGVNVDCIIPEENAQCTADNARYTKLELDQRGIELKKAIICCKAFHARRCLMFYQFTYPDTEFIIAPVSGLGGLDIRRDNWYQTELGQKRVLGELNRLGVQFTRDFIQLL